MLDSAMEVLAFAEGRTRDDVFANRQLALALVKAIEIVGEAAPRVSEGTRSQLRDIPWAEIVGMRNRLIHGYFEIDLDRLWDTVQDDVEPLVRQLEEVLGEDGD